MADPAILENLAQMAILYPLALLVGIIAATVLPIPIGYERGKVKWSAFCGTGMHWHTVYWWGGEQGFQSMHPEDANDT